MAIEFPAPGAPAGESAFTSYDGLRLHYDVLGDGEPLAVLPGGPGSDARYLGDLGGLAAVRRLVRLDPRAAGRSETPADRRTVSFPEQARDVEALRVHLGLERIDLLAHSAGCLTAQEYAARHPDRVRRLVLITPVGRAARETDPAELAALRSAHAAEPWYPAAAAAAERLSREDVPGAEGSLLRARMVPFSWHRWTRELRREYAGGHAGPPPWVREAFYAGSATPETNAARCARLAAAGVPVLVVAGASDGLIGTAPARLVAACHPGARLEVMQRCGHRPWVEDPERFRSSVEDFLAYAARPADRDVSPGRR